MIKPIHGTHCEVCLSPVQEWFHKHECKMFHGIEYLCDKCIDRINLTFGNKLIKYLSEYGGCLFDEIMYAEERTGNTFKRI
jgi:hypothetical protein